MTLEEGIMKLDLIASDAFEGGNANEFKQLAEWLKKLQTYEKIISELSEAMQCYDGCERCQGFREYSTSDFVDDVRSWVKQFEEVNVDGDSD